MPKSRSLHSISGPLFNCRAVVPPFRGSRDAVSAGVVARHLITCSLANGLSLCSPGRIRGFERVMVVDLGRIVHSMGQADHDRRSRVSSFTRPPLARRSTISLEISTVRGKRDCRSCSLRQFDYFLAPKGSSELHASNIKSIHDPRSVRLRRTPSDQQRRDGAD
jgi:hypothetical protein